jgi:hypothetical protein
MAAPPRKSVQINMREPVKEALVRQCRAHDRSQAKMIEIFIINAERGWLRHLTTEEQRRQYFSGEPDRDEARRKPRQRAAASADASA